MVKNKVAGFYGSRCIIRDSVSGVNRCCRCCCCCCCASRDRLTGARSFSQSRHQSSRCRVVAMVVKSSRRSALALAALVVVSQLGFLASTSPVSTASQRLQQLIYDDGQFAIDPSSTCTLMAGVAFSKCCYHSPRHTLLAYLVNYVYIRMYSYSRRIMQILYEAKEQSSRVRL